MQKVIPSLWFDMNAEEAMNFYVSIFPNSKIIAKDTYPDESLSEHFKDMKNKIINGVFELDGHKFICLDGGPVFAFNPSISFMLNFDPSRDEKAQEHLNELWEKLSEGGTVLMPLDEYPYSKRYGWIKDKYGLTWQLILTDPEGDPRPFIVPSLMFSGAAVNRAEEALNYYKSVFKNTREGIVAPYPTQTGPAKAGSLMFADLMLENQWFAVMDSGVEQDFTFNEAISLTIEVKDQAELDYYWAKLSHVPESEQCGWCKDKFGVSWQIVPTRLNELMNGADPEGVKRVTQALMKMHKLDISELEAAYEG